ncbi:cytochrome P450 CYP72A219-like [Iris pallida]|uniref:Cytochrome P450 CYP72A219-like n=1 Tax=Iris pallida TaxID=29817 RepID=A0AAX6G425_IRIPA|nr:cytochrome P450 CYP72A219-like [Iris pallida]
MVPSFLTSCSDLVKKWDGLAGSGGYCEVDVWTEFQALTGDVISRTAFGSSFEDGKRIFQLQNEQAKLAIEAARSPYIPGFRFIPTRKNKRRWLLDDRIKSMVRAIIDRKSETLQTEGSSNSDDLLTILLELSRDKKNGISINDVIEECKLFYLAGQETTASLLTWTLVLLSMHPSWQHMARDEALRVCRKDVPDLECINQLKIVPMILYEVLRLYPSIVSLTRRTENEIKLGEFTFPGGVDLLLPVILIHHDPECWGEDAEEFNPERFSNGISKAAAKDGRSVFYPFGWGPRTCLGQNFAMIQAKMALTLILQHFSFELSPSYSHAPYTVITLQPLHGAHIILHRL